MLKKTYINIYYFNEIVIILIFSFDRCVSFGRMGGLRTRLNSLNCEVTSTRKMAARAAMLAAKRAKENSLARMARWKEKRNWNVENHMSGFESHNPSVGTRITSWTSRCSTNGKIHCNIHTRVGWPIHAHKEMVTFLSDYRAIMRSQDCNNGYICCGYAGATNLRIFAKMISSRCWICYFLCCREIVKNLARYMRYFHNSWIWFFIVSSCLWWEQRSGSFRYWTAAHFAFNDAPKLRILVMGLVKVCLPLYTYFYWCSLLSFVCRDRGDGFGANDPFPWGRCTSIFDAGRQRLRWTDIMYTSMYGCKYWVRHRRPNMQSKGSTGGCHFLDTVHHSRRSWYWTCSLA